jgi:hypothetical protein
VGSSGWLAGFAVHERAEEGPLRGRVLAGMLSQQPRDRRAVVAGQDAAWPAPGGQHPAASQAALS